MTITDTTQLSPNTGLLPTFPFPCPPLGEVRAPVATIMEAFSP
jgi:hypothetical protein